MKRSPDWNKWMGSRELSKVERVQSSSELHLWRNHSTSAFTGRYFSKNQNAIGRDDSQKKDQQVLNISSPSTNFTTDSPVELQINANNEFEKINSHLSEKSVTITRRSSKPSQHESVQISTKQTRQHQRDRYSNYRHRLEESQLFSLIVSSNNVECYGTNCQPSVFNASHRCRTLSFEKLINTITKFPLMNDQDMKRNMSYISLTNLSNIMDHEPNVSRKNSHSRSMSNILMHKPSLFLADIFNKMTNEQRAKSIAQLSALHENLTKSNPAIDKLQRAKSLPDLNKKPTKLLSVASLLSERAENNLENKPFSTGQKHIDEDMISRSINPTTSDNTDEEVHTSVNISSPAEIVSFPEENIESIGIHNSSATESTLMHPSTINPSPISIKSSISNTNIGIVKSKISRTAHFLDPDLNEQPSQSKLKSSKTRQTNSSQSSNLSNPIKLKSFASSSNSLINSTLTAKHSSDNGTQENDLSSNKDVIPPSKASSSHNKAEDHPSSFAHVQSSNGGNSSNDITDHLSQNDINIPNTNPYKSVDIPSKRTLPLLKEMDEVSQHSKSPRSRLKNTPSLVISIDKETFPKTATKPIEDGDTSMVTRTTAASTNLTTNDDDDEQFKRGSLGLARDSLELLRNASPHHGSNAEQLIPYTNNDSSPGKTKSVLKTRLDSLDILPPPEFISYIAIDEVKGDKRLMEKQMRRRSLTLGGGTIVSCTSPKPKRDSLTLLQERYPGSMTPHAGCYHLSNSDSKHVEFIRGPGNTITPALHIGRGTKSKHTWGRPISPSVSNEYFHEQHFSNHTFDSSERSKSEMSIIGSPQQVEPKALPPRSSLETSPSPLTSTTTSFIDEEKVCLNKSDYDEMVRLLMTPLSKKRKKPAVKSTFESHIDLCINNRLTTFQNLILLIVSMLFYIFIFIKSQYWQGHN